MRKSHADKLRENVRSERGYAALAGVPVRADLVIPAERSERVKARLKPNGRPEGEAQDAVVEWLLANPRVHGLKRINSGSMGDKYVKFNIVYGKFGGEYMAALDLEFWYQYMEGWAVIKPVEVEMKAPGWKWSDNRHNRTEIMQWARIQYVREHGGIAGFCCGIEDVKRLLESA